MHCRIEKDHLLARLSTVAHAVNATNGLPILANILLEAHDGRLKLVGTDLTTAITAWAPLIVLEAAGAVTVPAKFMIDLLKTFPAGPVTLTLDTQTQRLMLEAPQRQVAVAGIAAEEFPTVPDAVAEGAVTVAIRSDDLAAAIRQVAFAAAENDTRPALYGINIELREDQATLVACDGFRLSTRTVALLEPVEQPVACILPAPAARELIRVLSADLPVTVRVSENALLFETATLTLVSCRIDAKYPDWQRVIPGSSTSRVVLDTAEFARTIRLAGLLAADRQPAVKITMRPGTPGLLTLEANGASGAGTATIDATVEGAGGQIALNTKFLAQAVAAIPTPTLAFEMTSPAAPALITPVGMAGFTQIAMPMTVH